MLQNQLVYRLPDHADIPRLERKDCRHVLLDRPWQGIPYAWLLGKTLGPVGALLALLKLGTPKRSLYLVHLPGLIANYGWLTRGFCRYYPIEADAVVIGPVYTPLPARGQGYGSFGLAKTLWALRKNGVRFIYIDTTSDNLAMQKVIAKCGFGEHQQVVTKTIDDMPASQEQR